MTMFTHTYNTFSFRRTPSYEMDLSSDSAASFGSGAATSLDLVGGDVQKALQVEQEKANLMAQV